MGKAVRAFLIPYDAGKHEWFTAYSVLVVHLGSWLTSRSGSEFGPVWADAARGPQAGILWRQPDENDG
jgi:hypothetical protein